MFYSGEFVRSRLDGLGEVVVGGEDAEVRFLDGRRLHVAGSTLTRIPPWKFERAEANLMGIERRLDLYIHGETSRPTAMVPRPAFNLETAMQKESQSLYHGVPSITWPSEIASDLSCHDGSVTVYFR